MAFGATGRVWLGRCAGEHGVVERVAIKMLSPEVAQDASLRKSLLDEARLAVGLEHPNMARVLGVGEHEGLPYVVYEWVDGVPLLGLCRSAEACGRLLPHGPALRVMIDVCRGLHAAHELRDASGAPLGLVHGDVTPRSILVSLGIAKVIDLGMSRTKGRAAGETWAAGPNKGTAQYMAPEQARGSPVDRRADVWAAGAVLFRAFTGAAAFESFDALSEFASGSGAAAVAVPRDVPAPVAAVLVKALCRDPAGRFATADELRMALEEATEDKTASVVFEELFATGKADDHASVVTMRSALGVGTPLSPAEPSPFDLMASSSGDEAEPVLNKGASLGRYMVLDALGRGGMGIVYAAYDPVLDRRVALKILRRATLDSADQERLVGEAVAMARLTHPNVVTVFDVGTFARRLFIAMELVEGETLRAWAERPRSWRETLAMYLQAGRGLAAAHAAGIVHRDFKPDNVLVGRDGRARVADFGLALGDSLPEAGARAGDPLGGEPEISIVGTPRYAAPEQLDGAQVDARADQFSFCAALWEALCGKPPFEGRSVLTLLDSIERIEPRPPQGRDIPARVRAALLRGLRPDADARFPSMDALLEALARETLSARWRTGVVAGAVLLGAVGLFAVERSTQRSRAEEAERACAVGTSELSGVWDAGMAAQMRQSFAASGVRDAADTADRVARKLDAFVSAWMGARSDACRAAHVRHEQPEDAFRLRTDCLDRARDEARASTELLARADAQVAKRGLTLAYGLPDVRWCADVPALRASVGLPDDPVRRAAAIALRQRIDAVSAAFSVGRGADSLGEMASIVEAARQLGHPPTTAAALHMKGRLLIDVRPSDAYPVLREALWIAIGSGDKAMALDLFNALARTTAQTGHAEDSRHWLEGGKAILGSLGAAATSLQRARNLYAEGYVTGQIEERPDLAIPLFEEVVAIYRRDFGVHLATSQAIFNLASMLMELGRVAEARPLFEEAEAMNETIAGSTARDTAVSQYGLGTCLADLGDPDRGDALLSASLTTMQRDSASYWIGAVLADRARVRLRAGRAQDAVADAEGAMAATGAAPVVALARVVGGDGLNGLGRFAEARQQCERAATMQPVAGMDPASPYSEDALRCQAEALLGLGRPADARPLLERSLGLHVRAHPADYARAELAMARTLVALHQDPARVRSLAASARDEFARYPRFVAEMHQAEALARQDVVAGR